MDGPWLPALLSGAVPPACNRICTKQLECNNGSSLASPLAALQPFCSPVPCPPPASPGSPAQPQTPQILQPGLPTLHLEGFLVCWCFPGELRPSSAVVHLQFSFPRSSQGFPRGETSWRALGTGLWSLCCIHSVLGPEEAPLVLSICSDVLETSFMKWTGSQSDLQRCRRFLCSGWELGLGIPPTQQASSVWAVFPVVPYPCWMPLSSLDKPLIPNLPSFLF